MPSAIRLSVACCARAMLVVGLGIGSGNDGLAQGTMLIRPEASSYTAIPGEALTVNIVVDPVPVTGLFSYGVTLAFDAIKATIGAGDIAVPPPLRFNGFTTGGPYVETLSGFAGVKGTVDVNASPLQLYQGSVIATFLLRPLGQAGDSFLLEAGLFRTLGSSESVFVDGAGGTLDNRLGFGSAMVTLVPEPKAAVIIMLAAIVLLPGLKRRNFA